MTAELRNFSAIGEGSLPTVESTVRQQEMPVAVTVANPAFLIAHVVCVVISVGLEAMFLVQSRKLVTKDLNRIGDRVTIGIKGWKIEVQWNACNQSPAFEIKIGSCVDNLDREGNPLGCDSIGDRDFDPGNPSMALG